MPVVLKNSTLLRISDKAVLLRWRNTEVWIPRTSIEAIPDPLPSIGSSLDCTVSDWIASQKGFNDAGWVTQAKPQNDQQKALLDRIKFLEVELVAARNGQAAADIRANAEKRRADTLSRELAKANARLPKLSGSALEIQTKQTDQSESLVETEEKSRFSHLEVD